MTSPSSRGWLNEVQDAMCFKRGKSVSSFLQQEHLVAALGLFAESANAGERRIFDS